MNIITEVQKIQGNISNDKICKLWNICVQDINISEGIIIIYVFLSMNLCIIDIYCDKKLSFEKKLKWHNTNKIII